jgi:hypothetical protein
VWQNQEGNLKSYSCYRVLKFDLGILESRRRSYSLLVSTKVHNTNSELLKSLTMHFPTSLPRSTGSPAAKITESGIDNHHIHSIHLDPFDGPPPPLISKTIRRARSSKRPHYGNIINPAEPPIDKSGPVKLFSPPALHRIHPRNSSHVKAEEVPPKNYDLVLPTDKAPSATSLHATGTGSNVDINNNFQRIKGIKPKPISKVRPPEFKKIFNMKRQKQEEDPEDSPTEASELHEMRKRKQEMQVKSQESEGRSTVGSRNKLGALISRNRGKPGDVETELDFGDPDHHPFDAARKRMMGKTRERKMRRKSGGAKISGSLNEEKNSNEHDSFIPENSHNFMHAPSPRGHIAAFRASKEEEHDEVDNGGVGSQVGDTARRMSAHLVQSSEQSEDTSRRASWATVEQHLPYREDSPERWAASTASSSGSTSDPHDLHDLDMAQNMETEPQESTDSSQKADPRFSSEIDQQNSSCREIPSHYLNHLNQAIFPPRASGSYYRPTLSPVSSCSPAPTSTGKLTSFSNSLKHAKDKWKIDHMHATKPSNAANDSLQKAHSLNTFNNKWQSDHESTPSKVQDVSLPKASSPPIPQSLRPGGLSVRNGTPTILSRASRSSASTNPALPFAIEQPTAEPDSLRLSTKGTVRTRPKISRNDFKFHEPELDLKSRQQKSAVSDKTVRFQEPTETTLERSITSTSVDIPRPNSPPPQPSPSPIRTSVKTPTASALEFWREADESLAPSESASAQPPNYRGQPPPDFWKMADMALETQKGGSPTLEEWIATLPGLGLGLGNWGNSDGALDWKYFQGLKATNKLKKRPSGSLLSDSAKSVQDVIQQNIETLEKVMEEIDKTQKLDTLVECDTPEEDFTQDEADVEDPTPETPPVDNNPPPIIDPSMLHPNYSPRLASYAPVPVSSMRRPNSRLGKDVASRLDSMEKYWAEQSIAMGTVLKKMLVVVDTLIIKEREQAQRESRRMEMGWSDGHDDDHDGDQAKGKNGNENEHGGESLQAV